MARTWARSRWTWPVGVGVGLLLVLLGVLLRAGGRIESDRSDHTVQSPTAAVRQLPPGQPVVQQFTATGDGLSAVSMRFGTFVAEQPCTLDVRLTEDAVTVHEGTVACSSIQDAVSSAVLTVPPIAGSAGHRYTLTMEMRPDRPGLMAMFMVVPSADRPPALLDGDELDGALELHTDYGHFPRAYDEVGTALRRLQQFGPPWRAPVAIVLLVLGAVALLVAVAAAPTRRLGFGLLLAFAVVKGVLWSAVIPPLEGIDEPAHYSYAQFMSVDHAIPRRDDSSRGNTTVSDELATAVEVFHAPAVPRDDRPDFGAGHQSPAAAELDAPLDQHANGNGLAAGYSPAYYAVPAAIDAVTPGSLDVRLGAMRLWSVLLGAATVAAAVVLGRRLFPERTSIALLFGAAVALHPMLTQQTSVLNNDALVIAGGAWCLVAASELTRRERAWWVTLAAGLALGLAVLGKPHALVWAPVLAIAWLIGRWRGHRGVTWWRDGGLAAAGFLATFGLWLVVSKVFDYPGVGVTAPTPGDHRGLADFLHVLSINDFLAVRQAWIFQFWGEFSWNDVPFAGWVYRVITVAVLAGVLLVAVWAVRTVARTVRASAPRRLDIDDTDATAVVCLLAIAGTVVLLYLLAFQFFRNTGRNDFLQGRYALMVAPAALLLPVLALKSLVPRLSPVVPLAVITSAMLVLNVGGLALLTERFYL